MGGVRRVADYHRVTNHPSVGIKGSNVCFWGKDCAKAAGL